MPLSPAPAKRSLMFELLRHQHMSHQMTRAEGDALEHVEAQAFLSRALQSWDAPVAPKAPAAARLSAKTCGDHEFFRTVRA